MTISTLDFLLNLLLLLLLTAKLASLEPVNPTKESPEAIVVTHRACLGILTLVFYSGIVVYMLGMVGFYLQIRWEEEGGYQERDGGGAGVFCIIVWALFWIPFLLVRPFKLLNTLSFIKKGKFNHLLCLQRIHNMAFVP